MRPYALRLRLEARLAIRPMGSKVVILSTIRRAAWAVAEALKLSNCSLAMLAGHYRFAYSNLINLNEAARATTARAAGTPIIVDHGFLAGKSGKTVSNIE